MIYMMRHGETVWNSERRLQGSLDSPLTARGIGQAQALGRLLAEIVEQPTRFRIVCSPLGRAWQTAVIVAAEMSLPPHDLVIEPHLAEMSCGRWEGVTVDEIQERDIEAWERRRADRWNVETPGGESYADVAIRARKWFSGVSEADRLIVVCHGVVSKVVRGLYAGLSEQETLELSEPQDRLFQLSNGQIRRVGRLGVSAAGSRAAPQARTTAPERKPTALVRAQTHPRSARGFAAAATENG